MVRTPPKFVWTRTPTVYPPSLGGRRREEVPMPPLKPNATVPVLAPTEPSSTAPLLAFLIAANTSSRVMCRRPLMSFTYLRQSPPNFPASPSHPQTHRFHGSGKQQSL